MRGETLFDIDQPTGVTSGTFDNTLPTSIGIDEEAAQWLRDASEGRPVDMTSPAAIRARAWLWRTAEHEEVKR